MTIPLFVFFGVPALLLLLATARRAQHAAGGDPVAVPIGRRQR